MSTIQISLILLLTLYFGCLAAENPAPTGSYLVGERPNASGPATEIGVNVLLLDIDDINDASQYFSVDMFMTARWNDPRLALPDAQRTGGKRTLPFSEIWTPGGLIVNDRGLTPQLPMAGDIDDLGNVEYQQRWSGKLSLDMELNEFPFDIQRLPIDIVSYQHGPDELRISPSSTILSNDTDFSAEGWTYRLLEPEFGEFRVLGTDTVRPRITFLIEAERDSQYYLLTMFLPVSLIVFMSWTVFWLQPDIIPSRIAISTASIFSLMAFGFGIRVSLPKVSYMTRADFFVIACTLMVFLALATAVIGSRWVGNGHMDRALRLNALARWVYFGIFCVIALATSRF